MHLTRSGDGEHLKMKKRPKIRRSFCERTENFLVGKINFQNQRKIETQARERNRKTVGKLTINHLKITRTGHWPKRCRCLVNFGTHFGHAVLPVRWDVLSDDATTTAEGTGGCAQIQWLFARFVRCPVRNSFFCRKSKLQIVKRIRRQPDHDNSWSSRIVCCDQNLSIFLKASLGKSTGLSFDFLCTENFPRTICWKIFSSDQTAKW